MNNIKLGDRVFWKSQAGGHWTTKYGTVIYLNPSSHAVRVDEALRVPGMWLDEPSRLQVIHATNNQKQFTDRFQKALVAVDRREKDGKVETYKRLRYYAPAVELQHETENSTAEPEGQHQLKVVGDV